MSTSVSTYTGNPPISIRKRIGVLFGGLIVGNALAWTWAFVAFRHYPVLLGTAALAYTFGLRHAFDADHIAAIDNVTRKLMQEGKKPISVGLYFSLGHSSAVVALSLAITLAADELQTRFETLKSVGVIVGTSVSAFFLFAIATANVLVLISIYRTF